MYITSEKLVLVDRKRIGLSTLSLQGRNASLGTCQPINKSKEQAMEYCFLSAKTKLVK
jgi:hypothetical protein